MKKEAKKVLLGVACIVFMAIILIGSRDMDLITRRFGITFFGCILCFILVAIALDITASVQRLQLEKWKAKRAAKIQRYYEVDKDDFNALSKRAMAHGWMVSFIEETKPNRYIEVILNDEEEI